MKKPMTHTIHVWHMHIWLIFMVGTVNVPYMNAMGNELHYEDAEVYNGKYPHVRCLRAAFSLASVLPGH